MDVEFFDCISSTNDYFKNKSAFGTLKKGDAVVAFSQTKGRGRNNRIYSSSVGGIYLSVCYGQIENSKVENYYSLMPASALYLCKFFNEKLGIKTSIKWPNDILKNDKKCTGILAERSIKGDLILGVGINYDNVNFQGELRSTATSLYTASEKPKFNKKDFALQIVDVLLNIKLFKNNPKAVNEYDSLCSTVNKEVEIKNTNGNLIQKGFAKGIDENGELLLLLSDGTIYRCSIGEVSLSKKQ